MVDMGKSIKALAPYLWDLLGVLLDADPAHRCMKPQVRKLNVNEDVEINLGMIGAEGKQYEEWIENWADLEADDIESSSFEDEDKLHIPFLGLLDASNESAESGLDSDSDDSDDGSTNCSKKHQKQDPAK